MSSNASVPFHTISVKTFSNKLTTSTSLLKNRQNSPKKVKTTQFDKWTEIWPLKTYEHKKGRRGYVMVG